MKIRDRSRDEHALAYFAEHQVLTLSALAEVLRSSTITAHRRLQEWKALTSCNMYGKYHTLPSIPKFNAYGIWRYGDICFSRYGTLKQTVCTLVRKSSQGMDHGQLEQILGVNPKYSLSQYAELPGIRSEQHRGRIIYFSDDPQVYAKQKRRRIPPVPSAEQLPSDAVTILILVTLIEHPGMNSDQIATHLRKQGHGVSPEGIAALFDHYEIDKKN